MMFFDKLFWKFVNRTPIGSVIFWKFNFRMLDIQDIQIILLSSVWDRLYDSQWRMAYNVIVIIL